MKKTPIRFIATILAVVPLLQSCAGLIGEDRRTSATVLEDQTIELRIRDRIKEKYEDKLHVSATCFNRFVLLTGEAPTDEIRQDLTIVALEVQNVRNVQNEVIVAGNSSFTSRSSDTLLTSNIKGRLTQNKDVSANHVKVVTKNSTAFLMGLVTRAEAEAAAQTAATTSGTQRVVKVFEYID